MSPAAGGDREAVVDSAASVAVIETTAVQRGARWPTSTSPTPSTRARETRRSPSGAPTTQAFWHCAEHREALGDLELTVDDDTPAVLRASALLAASDSTRAPSAQVGAPAPAPRGPALATRPDTPTVSSAPT